MEFLESMSRGFRTRLECGLRRRFAVAGLALDPEFFTDGVLMQYLAVSKAHALETAFRFFSSGLCASWVVYQLYEMVSAQDPENGTKELI